MTIHVALAGAGAFGQKHLDALALIPDVKVVSVVGRELDKTQEVAARQSTASRTPPPSWPTA
jgi:2-hydroxy-4-carboxymuconate semialdehyde hemiacetal dehydrogenase